MDVSEVVFIKYARALETRKFVDNNDRFNENESKKNPKKRKKKMKALNFSSIFILAFLSGNFALGADRVILTEPTTLYPIVEIQATNSAPEQILITPAPTVDRLNFNAAERKICERTKTKHTTEPTPKRAKRRWFIFW